MAKGFTDQRTRDGERPRARRTRQDFPPRDKQARYRRALVREGRCPHCGEFCAPYYECAQRRRYKRARYRRQREPGWRQIARASHHDCEVCGRKAVWYYPEGALRWYYCVEHRYVAAETFFAPSRPDRDGGALNGVEAPPGETLVVREADLPGVSGGGLVVGTEEASAVSRENRHRPMYELGEVVCLAVQPAGDGWQAVFQGSGFLIVSPRLREKPEVGVRYTLQAMVPPGVGNGPGGAGEGEA